MKEQFKRGKSRVEYNEGKKERNEAKQEIEIVLRLYLSLSFPHSPSLSVFRMVTRKTERKRKRLPEKQSKP